VGGGGWSHCLNELTLHDGKSFSHSSTGESDCLMVPFCLLCVFPSQSGRGRHAGGTLSRIASGATSVKPSRCSHPGEAVRSDRFHAVMRSATSALRRPGKPFEDRCMKTRVPRCSQRRAWTARALSHPPCRKRRLDGGQQRGLPGVLRQGEAETGSRSGRDGPGDELPRSLQSQVVLPSLPCQAAREGPIRLSQGLPSCPCPCQRGGAGRSFRISSQA
jgi:hypothetical protein